MKKKMRKRKIHFIKIYTFFFILMMFLAFLYFWSSGKIFINNFDGWDQHYKALAYYGEWLKLLAKNIIINHKFEVPTFTFGMGYGADLYTTLHYYVIGDPLTIVAVFCPLKYQHILYVFLVIARLYIAGIVFSQYCFYTYKKSEYAVLAGTYIYILCGFALYASVVHPFFLNPMIYFPLLALGVERIIKEKKPLLFIVAVFISAISNFYFLYMLSLLIFIYILLKLFFGYKKTEVLKNIFKFAGYYSLGFFLSAFILLPTVLMFFQDARSGINFEYSEILYPLSFYRSFLDSFSTLNRLDVTWTAMGYGGYALLSVIVFLSSWKKQDNFLKYYFLLLSAFLLLPWAGRFMNGFSYATNRWIWAYSFIISIIVVIIYEKLKNITKFEKTKVLVFLLLYFVINLLLDNALSFGGWIQLVLTVIFTLAVFYRKNFKFFHSDYYYNAVILIGVLGSLACNMFFLYSSHGINYGRNYSHKFAGIFGELMDNEAIALKKIVKNGFYRYTASDEIMTKGRNANIMSGISSTQYYYSLSNGNITKFRNEMSVLDPLIQSYKTLDDRTFLNEAASVNYYMTRKKDLLPFGYKLSKRNIYNNISVYENKYALPFGYTYDSYITEDAYNQMDAVQKQQAILQGVVLNPEDIKTLNSKELKDSLVHFENYYVPFTLDYDKTAVSKQDNTFVVTKKNAVVNIIFNGNGLKECETYLIVEGLNFKGVREIDLYGSDSDFDPFNVYTQKDFDRFDNLKKKELEFNGKYYIEKSEIYILVKILSDKKLVCAKKIRYTTPNYVRYPGRHDFIINSFYNKKPIKKMQIVFPYIGKYSLSDIKVVCQKFDSFPSYVGKLKEHTLKNVNLHNKNQAFATNLITGDIRLDSSKILLLALPYSDGWTAFVDDKETKIYKANTMFMALELEPGEHRIKLRYETPGLKTGLIISVVSLILLCGTICFHRNVFHENLG